MHAKVFLKNVQKTLWYHQHSGVRHLKKVFSIFERQFNKICIYCFFHHLNSFGPMLHLCVEVQVFENICWELNS